MITPLPLVVVEQDLALLPELLAITLYLALSRLTVAAAVVVPARALAATVVLAAGVKAQT